MLLSCAPTLTSDELWACGGAEAEAEEPCCGVCGRGRNGSLAGTGRGHGRDRGGWRFCWSLEPWTDDGLTVPCVRPCLVPKILEIFRHIKYLDICMEH
jgi:hypothetical protein